MPQGCILGLLGENGAGKSTAIRLILNMIQKGSGSVLLLGRYHAHDLHLTREEVGVVLDEVGISGCLTPLLVGNIMSKAFRNWNPQK